MTGSITLKEDGTYEENFIEVGDDNNNDDNTGKWELSADGKKFTVDKGTDDEMIFDVLSLTSSGLVIETTRTELEDFNDDEVDETLKITMKMTFVR